MSSGNQAGADDCNGGEQVGGVTIPAKRNTICIRIVFYEEINAGVNLSSGSAWRYTDVT
jgi:hypothetical protein